MKTITPTELRSNVYKILDEVLRTGAPIEIIRDGQKLVIQPVTPPDKLSSLISRPEFIKGNPDDLVNLTWEEDLKLDLP